MVSPPLYADEPHRLATLRRLNVLETPMEERFERITRAIRPMLKVEIAAISLVDAGRQWFKSVQGLPLPEMSRDASFCGHAVVAESLLVVPDARKDSRFDDNPIVTSDPRIRFYAGCPIRIDGTPVGTLCVADRRPRRVEAQLPILLRSLACIVEAELAAGIPSATQRALVAELDVGVRQFAVDAVTRMWSRQAILTILERECRSAQADAQGVGALFVDVGDGGHLHHRLGIAGGDAVLRATAQRMLQALRPQDAVGRFAGQQFLGVVTGVNRAGFTKLARGLHRQLTETALHRGAELPVRMGSAWTPARRRAGASALLDAAERSGSRGPVEVYAA